MLEIIEPKRAQKPLLDSMAQLYSYDFSEFNEWALGLDGLYPPISCFAEMWDDPRRYVRLLIIDKEPSGFAVVRQVGTASYDMEQFFVLRKFRRAGVGRKAAIHLFDEFSGEWTVEQIATNKAAQVFWRAVISDYTDGKFEDTNGDAPVQRFVS